MLAELPAVDARPFGDSLEHLLAELALLDLALRARVRAERALAAAGPEPPEPLAAYVIGEAEVDHLLTLPPGADTGAVRPEPELELLRQEIDARVAAARLAGVPMRLADLADTFGLGRLEVDAVVLALAPELDPRFERLYGYLQDDVTRRAASVGLALALTGEGLPGRLSGRAAFGDGAALARHRLLSTVEEHDRAGGSLLQRTLRLSARVAAHLLGDDELEAELAPYIQLLTPDRSRAGADPDPAGNRERADRIAALVAGHPDLVVQCHGPDGAAARKAAELFCSGAGRVLLVARTGRLAALSAGELADVLALLAREARLRQAVLFWPGLDALLGPKLRLHRELVFELVASHPWPVLLAGVESDSLDLGDESDDGGLDGERRPAGRARVRLPFPIPDAAARVRLWTSVLGEPDPARLALAELAATFRFGEHRIRQSAALAGDLALARGPGSPLSAEDLREACRRRSHRGLAAVAHRVKSVPGWDDLVLPAEQLQQLGRIAEAVRLRETVHDHWGFARTGEQRGLNVLFAGPPGTGKTMAAAVLAGSLGMDLYTIDLSSTVSKYIGETEKNLARIFAEAEAGNAILFFDEADALFGKRTTVRDAHDRYANLETSYLLQKLQDHDGTVILATNLRKNMDDAFVRRLHATLDFPIPAVAERLAIWQRSWPAQAPLAGDVDLQLLAREVDLPGGNIRTIVLAAAFLAAADATTPATADAATPAGAAAITMAHLLSATRREYQKVGKVLSAEDFGATP